MQFFIVTIVILFNLVHSFNKRAHTYVSSAIIPCHQPRAADRGGEGDGLPKTQNRQEQPVSKVSYVEEQKRIISLGSAVTVFTA
jgi:hypothetical protein